MKAEVGRTCSMGDKCVATKYYLKNLKAIYSYEYPGADGSY
jgi:hypothetical protein